MWENPNAREIDHLKIIEKKKMEKEFANKEKSSPSIFGLALVLILLLCLSVSCTFMFIAIGNVGTNMNSVPEPIVEREQSLAKEVNLRVVRSSVDHTRVWIKNTIATMTFKDGTQATTDISTCKQSTICTITVDWSSLSALSLRICTYPDNPRDNSDCQVVHLFETTETILLKVDG